MAENQRFIAQMESTWTISKLGTPRHAIGIGIEWDRTTHKVSLSQTTLIDKIVIQFGQHDAAPLSVPMDPNQKLQRIDRKTHTPEDIDKLSKLPYHPLVGSLLYLCIGTCPDISYAVQQLSQFLDNFSFAHWAASLRVVRYLKGTRHLKLRLGGQNPVQLVGFTDADWANCLNTRRSVGGFAFFLGGGAISWLCRKQKTVVTSSAESEYIAAYESASECTWIHSLLVAIDFPQNLLTPINCDNTAAITLSKDSLYHNRVKHIDIKYHFLREFALAGDLRLSYVNTRDNIADIFTKALDLTKFARFRTLLGLH